MCTKRRGGGCECGGEGAGLIANVVSGAVSGASPPPVW